MTTILHIDSSILGGYSASRALSAAIVARQKALHPGAEVIYRDLVADAALHLSDAHMAVLQGAAVSDTQSKQQEQQRKAPHGLTACHPGIFGEQ